MIDNFIYNNKFSVLDNIRHKNYELVSGDFCDIHFVDKYIYDVSNVVILGGLVGDPITKKYPKESNYINLYKMKELIDLLYKKNLNKLIFVSTCSNYGFMDENKLANEESELKPLSLYAEAKVEIEKYILENHNNKSTISTILRFATAFGLSTRMRFDLTINEFTRYWHLVKV